MANFKIQLQNSDTQCTTIGTSKFELPNSNSSPQSVWVWNWRRLKWRSPVAPICIWATSSALQRSKLVIDQFRSALLASNTLDFCGRLFLRCNTSTCVPAPQWPMLPQNRLPENGSGKLQVDCSVRITRWLPEVVELKCISLYFEATITGKPVTFHFDLHRNVKVFTEFTEYYSRMSKTGCINMAGHIVVWWVIYDQSYGKTYWCSGLQLWIVVLNCRSGLAFWIGTLNWQCQSGTWTKRLGCDGPALQAP